MSFPFGNLLCFDYRYNKKSLNVVFYNTEGEENIITPVSDSFSDLINRLYALENI